VAVDATRIPEQGLEPWQPLKLYFTAIPASGLRQMGERMAALGIENPFDRQRDPDEATTIERPFGTPDELITAALDVQAFAATKRAAVAAHRTQMGPEQFFMRIPPEAWTEICGHAFFRRVASLVAAPGKEDNRFAGVPPEP